MTWQRRDAACRRFSFTTGAAHPHAGTCEDIASQLELEGAFENVPSNLLPLLRGLLRGEMQHEHVALLVGFYSNMALRRHLESLGFLVISCDYRHAEGPGMHQLMEPGPGPARTTWSCQDQVPFWQ